MSAILHNTERFGKQNSDMVEASATVYGAILELLEMGLTVLGFSTRNGKPVVVVDAYKAADTLTNAVAIRRVTKQRIERVHVALVKECQVEWVSESERRV